MTYGGSDAVVQTLFGNYTTEDGVFAAIDLVPFIPAVNPELFWGLRALKTSVFQQNGPSRADASLVRDIRLLPSLYSQQCAARRKEKLEKVALDGSVECCAPPPRWCDLEL